MVDTQAAKQPWEMTRSEFDEMHGIAKGQKGGGGAAFNPRINTIEVDYDDQQAEDHEKTAALLRHEAYHRHRETADPKTRKALESLEREFDGLVDFHASNSKVAREIKDYVRQGDMTPEEARKKLAEHRDEITGLISFGFGLGATGEEVAARVAADDQGELQYIRGVLDSPKSQKQFDDWVHRVRQMAKDIPVLSHYQVIKDAVAKGHAVPGHILDEYPEITRPLARYTLYRSLMEQAGLPPKSEPEWREAVLERYAARAERDADLELYALELKDFDHEPWSEDSSGMLTHRFATEGPKGTTPYEARMVPQHSDPQQRPVYDMAFIDPTSSRPYGVTGAGGAPETIAHVASLLNHTVKTKAPNAITFSAAEPTRQRAYRMAMRHLAHRHPDYVPVSVGHDPTDIHDFAIVHREHLPHFESHLATTTGQKAWHIPAVGQPDPHRAKINELTKPKKEITNLKPLDIQYEPERLPSAAPISGPSPWGGEPLEAPTTPNRGWFGPKPRSKPARYTMTAQEIDDAVAGWKAPSEAQIEAENYRKPTISWKGLTIKIETPKGERRRPEWPSMPAHYGYFSRVGQEAVDDARDGDKPDVFVGPHPESDLVVVIDQETPGGRFDEWKVIIGTVSKQQAIDLYRRAYTPGWRVGPATSMTVDQFKTWLDAMPAKGRIAEQVSRYTEPGEPDRYAAREWTGCDLDGTLAYFDGQFSKWEIGPPIWRMVERVKRWLAQGRDVRILTARLYGPDAEQQRRLIQDWCRKYIGRVLPITNQKDPAMAELWDDRAIQVARNTGEPVGRFTQDGEPDRYAEPKWPTNLFRAADDNYVTSGTSFSESPEHAAAYLNNPGFGGHTLWRVPVRPTNVLDLADSQDLFADLSQASGVQINPSEHQHHPQRAIATSDELRDALAERGYHWVRFPDDYPEGSTTWAPVHSDAVDQLDDVEWQEHSNEPDLQTLDRLARQMLQERGVDLERYAATRDNYALEIKQFPDSPWSESHSRVGTRPKAHEHQFTVETDQGPQPYRAKLYMESDSPDLNWPQYNFQFSHLDHNENPHGVLGTGGQHRVFSHVASLLLDALHRIGPSAISLSAQEPSRRKLYRHLVGRIQEHAPEYHGVTIGDDPEDSAFFAIVHQDHLPAFAADQAHWGERTFRLAKGKAEPVQYRQDGDPERYARHKSQAGQRTFHFESAEPTGSRAWTEEDERQHPRGEGGEWIKKEGGAAKPKAPGDPDQRLLDHVRNLLDAMTERLDQGRQFLSRHAGRSLWISSSDHLQLSRDGQSIEYTDPDGRWRRADLAQLDHWADKAGLEPFTGPEGILTAAQEKAHDAGSSAPESPGTDPAPETQGDRPVAPGRPEGPRGAGEVEKGGESLSGEPDAPPPTAPPDADPREAATATTKAQLSDPEEYAYARRSAIPNAGRDIVNSSRHRRNAWRGLEDAEQRGTAEQLVTRANLLKNEPLELSAHVTRNPLTTLVMHYAMQAFPPQPNNRYSSAKTPEEQAKARRQYLDAYRQLKAKAESLAATAENPLPAIKAMQSEVGAVIRELRGQGQNQDRYNVVANSLVATLQSLTRHGQTSVMGKANEFARHYRDRYGLSPTDTTSEELHERLADHVGDVLEGRSFRDSFGLEAKKRNQEFDPADLYVSHAERRGGPRVPGNTAAERVKYLEDSIGFFGVQWGNSVTDKEREHHAQKAVEAFVDLADILGLPVSDISQGGQLGLAIGARGHGTALAHYEPQLKMPDGSEVRVINLTRKSGVGSLAHEWGHFFDNMLEGYGRDKFMSEDHGFTHEIIDQNGRRYLTHGGAVPSSGAEKRERPDTAIRQAYARWAEAVQSFKTRLRGVIREAVADGSIPRSKAQYWISTREVFARTFERYVQRKLEGQGRANTYLSGVATHDLWPTDQEVEAMTPAFDAIFDAYRAMRHPGVERHTILAGNRRVRAELARYAQAAGFARALYCAAQDRGILRL